MSESAVLGGAVLKAFRASRGVTVKECAKSAGVTEKAIRTSEGRDGQPGWDKVLRHVKGVRATLRDFGLFLAREYGDAPLTRDQAETVMALLETALDDVQLRLAYSAGFNLGRLGAEVAEYRTTRDLVENSVVAEAGEDE